MFRASPAFTRCVDNLRVALGIPHGLAALHRSAGEPQIVVLALQRFGGIDDELLDLIEVHVVPFGQGPAQVRCNRATLG